MKPLFVFVVVAPARKFSRKHAYTSAALPLHVGSVAQNMDNVFKICFFSPLTLEIILFGDARLQSP